MALALLLRRRKRSTAAAVENGLDVAHVAAALFPAVRHELTRSRQLARIAGASRLESEAARLGFELTRRATIVSHELAADVYRANAAAKSYVRRWLGKAVGETTGEAVETAHAATTGSLRRIVVTENAQAYNEGRLRAARSLQLFKQWDAILDAVTCYRCRALDKMVVPIGQSFDGFEPGDVHPWCRCSFTLITQSESLDEAA